MAETPSQKPEHAKQREGIMTARSLITRIKVTVEKRKLKEGYSYVLRWRDPETGKRFYEHAGYDNKLAKRKKAVKERDLLLGQSDIQSGLYSFDQFEEDFTESQKHRLKESTFIDYLAVLRQFRCFFSGKRCLQDITPLDVERYISSRLSEIKKISLNTETRTLKAMFNYAVQWEKLNKNPFAKVKFFKIPDKEIRVLSPVEEKKVLRTIQNLQGTTEERKLRFTGIFLIALQGGLRSSEIRYLRWKDIDLNTGEVNLVCRDEWSTKSWKNRTVYVTSDTLEILKRLKMIQRKEKPFYYAHASSISHVFRQIKRKSGVSFTLHDCRRTCASRMAENGVPVQVAKEYLGHADIQTTMKHYTKISKEFLKDAMLKTAVEHKKEGKKIPFTEVS